MSFLALAPAAISAGGSILSGLMGSKAADRAAQMQNLNLQLQSAIANRSLASADRAQGISLAGQTDAEGNQTVYDPATNTWHTILTANQKKLQSASDSEQYQRNTVDAAIARRRLIANDTRQTTEGNVADGLLSDMQHKLSQPTLNNGNAGSAGARLLNDRNVLDSQQAALRGFETQGLRSGNGNILDAIDRSRAESGSALAHNEAAAAGGNAAPDPYSSVGPTADLYNSFASRASASPGSNFSPFAGGGSLTQAIANQARNSALTGGLGSSAGNTASNAFENGIGPLMKPNFSGAQSMLGTSSGISGFLKDPNVSSYLSKLFGGGGASGSTQAASDAGFYM